MRVWLRFFSEGDFLSENELIQSLNHAGIGAYTFDQNASQGPGVIFFNAINRQLCEFLSETSRNSLERVLAIAMTHHSLIDAGAWRLLRAGASDVFAWNNSTDPVREIVARFERWNVIDQLVESPLVQNNLVGQSPVWKTMLRQIVEVAHFTDAPVLVMGETGTGKELAARLIHTLDQRPSKHDLVVLDCSTIVPELSGSEFFGHERGAFTGAVAPRDGAFALANGGTLFLDEVGDLPLGLQSQLLRVVQEHTYKRLGSNSWQQANFRLICATNKDLFQEVTMGKFRNDLYYRIANFICKLPPLRERTEDILPLVRHFMQESRPDKVPPELDESVREYLIRREYPGNVRDLKHLCNRINHRWVEGRITSGCIPKEEFPPADSEPSEWLDDNFEESIRRALSLGIGLKDIGRRAEEIAIRIAIHEADGTLKNAARRLGITDRALQMRRAASRERAKLKDDEKSN